MERGTIDKQFLTTLANNLREIQGTSEKLTPQELIDGYKVLKSEEVLYTNLNEMTFGAGFTLTLICDDSVINSDYFYSLDSGVTWLPFTSSNMVLSGVTKIRFKTTTTTSNYIAVGTTNGNHDIQFSGPNAGSIDREITEDTTWYVFTDVDKGGSSD